MKLLTNDIHDRLIKNGRIRAELAETGKAEADFLPVVKLFTTDAGCTWLLTELDPEDPDIAFGLCDLGMGYPELGCVRISELKAVRGKLGLPVERVMYKRDLKSALQRMLESDEAYVLDVVVPYTEHVLPFIPAGHTVADMIWKE